MDKDKLLDYLAYTIIGIAVATVVSFIIFVLYNIPELMIAVLGISFVGGLSWAADRMEKKKKIREREEMRERVRPSSPPPMARKK